MTNVILHPAARPNPKSNFERSVQVPLNMDDIRPLMSSKELTLLEYYHSDGDVRAWGFKGGKSGQAKWNRIQEGDIGLFYTDGEDKLFTAATVITFKTQNEALARKIWGVGPVDGRPWEYMYFMRDYRSISIPAAALYSKAGFVHNFVLQGTLIPRKPETSDLIIREFALDRGDTSSNRGGANETSQEGEPILDPGDVLAKAHSDLVSALRDSGLNFGSEHDSFVRSFLCSIATKPFVILTGLSGSGKTQIAIRFGEWLGNDLSLLVPVRPDWTGSDSVFGYEDVLLEPAPDGRRAWHVPAVLSFILAASHNESQPHLLVLDEMNLAHVERYFADFLSGLESGKPCIPNLKEDEGLWRLDPEGPAFIPLPNNLWVVGTVNVDETTYMFSPKVLDRANTFELRVKGDDLDSRLTKPRPSRPANRDLIKGMLSLAQDTDWHVNRLGDNSQWYDARLREIHSMLSDSGHEFGHRVFYEILRFVTLMEAAGESSRERALDSQVLQKLLPRMNGSRRELEPTLLRVARFCFSMQIEQSENISADLSQLEPTRAKLPRSFDKVRRMIDKLRANQFVSFTE